MTKYPSIVLFLIMSCSSSKKISKDPCLFEQKFSSYKTTLNDSTYLLTNQKLGKFYFNFIIDSCSKSNKNDIILSGFVTFPDNTFPNHQRPVGEVNFIQAIPFEKSELQFSKYLGITDSTGKFNITVKVKDQIRKNNVFILLNKIGYDPVAVLLNWQR